MKKRARHRSKIEIVARILEIIKDEPKNITTICRQVNIDGSKAKEMLQILTEKRMVIQYSYLKYVDDWKSKYQISKTGLQWLRYWHIVARKVGMDRYGVLRRNS